MEKPAPSDKIIEDLQTILAKVKTWPLFKQRAFLAIAVKHLTILMEEVEKTKDPRRKKRY